MVFKPSLGVNTTIPGAPQAPTTLTAPALGSSAVSKPPTLGVNTSTEIAPIPPYTPPYPNDDSRKIYEVKSERWSKNANYSFVVADSYEGYGFVYDITPVSGWREFVLPINPQAISVSVPFAISLIPTTRGILEEHNGTVFRNISISGTTGVAAGVRTYKAGKGMPNLRPRAGTYGGGLGAKTIGAVFSLASAVSNLFGGDSPPSLTSGIYDSDEINLGYTKLHQLLNYFVAYS